MPRVGATTYAARQPPSEQGEEPVTVLVTGFGPFLQKFPRNSSWEIASTLPALLPATPDQPTPIHIYVHHAPIRVAYSTVTSLVPTLLPPGNPIYPPPSIILHIGLAAGRTFYTLEKGAHSRGYGAIPDVDGQRFRDEDAEKLFPKEKYPGVLKTSFDTGDVLERWKENLSSSESLEGVEKEEKHIPDVRTNPDAGNFMCGFIYWNSLAHCYSIKEDERPVAFMHVPDLSDSPEKLETGREVAIALIKALVESRRKLGVVDGGHQVGAEGGELKRNVAAGTDVNFA